MQDPSWWSITTLFFIGLAMLLVRDLFRSHAGRLGRALARQAITWLGGQPPGEDLVRSSYDDVYVLDPERPVPPRPAGEIVGDSLIFPSRTNMVDKQCQTQTTYTAVRKASHPRFQLTAFHSTLGVYDGRGRLLPEQHRAPAVEAGPPTLQGRVDAALRPSGGASGPGSAGAAWRAGAVSQFVATSLAAGARRLASGCI